MRCGSPPAGRSAGLRPLAIPPLPTREAADAIALTPDGTRLAVAIQIGGQDGKVEVITLATGAVRTWTTTRGGDGRPENLSWDAAGRRLAFFWSGATSAAGLWLLDTSAPGAGLLSGQRLLPQKVGPDDVQSALISPDARTIIASVTYDGTMRVTRGTVVGGIVEVSAQTGRPLRTLLAQRAAHSSDAGWYITSCRWRPSTQPVTTCSSAAASSAGSTAAGSPHCPVTRWPRARPPGDATLQHRLPADAVR